MSLSPGSRLGPFEISAPLGAGGMGEVWRATDTRVGRPVALKVLPEKFFEDEERRARFSREARVLANLNHPGIATLYSFEEVPGPPPSSTRHLLVMELVEGDGLDKRMERGPMALDEALPIALQIAQALEAAHDKGIIHRDLKPANVKVSDGGKVKLLDFGLAKALAEGPAGASSPSVTQSPTLSAHATDLGVLLGTAAYMSPEQARGKAVDRRADVWAFGVVLHEMLTGERMFAGETISDTLAAVLRADVEWSKLPAGTPPAIRHLLARCLQRDLQRRLPDIGTARLEIQEALAGPAEELAVAALGGGAAGERQPVPAWRRHLPWGIAAALLVASALLTRQVAVLARRPQPVVRASIPPPDGTSFWLESNTPGPPALSPDGKVLAFSAGVAGTVRLWVRALDAGEARVLAGTEGAQYPFWSPEGRSIGFFADGKLKAIEAAGGSPVTLCAAEDGKGGSWSASGVIVFAPGATTALSKVAASGGEPAPLTKFDEKRGDSSHRLPFFLPDGRRFLYLARVKGGSDENAVMVGSLDGGPETQLVRSGAAAAYASGSLLFLRERTLMARPLDPSRLTFTGDPVPVAEKISFPSAASGFAVFTASRNGVLVYQIQRGETAVKLEWVGRDGKVTGTLGEPGQYQDVVLSPDTRSAAVSTKDPASGSRDLWIFDIARNLRTRFTFDATSEQWPLFTPDGRALVYASDRKGKFDLYRKPLGGTGGEELLVESKADKRPFAFTADSRFLVYGEDSKDSQYDIAVLPVSAGPEQKPRTFMKTRFNEYPAALSPDNRFLAYGSDESGQLQLYVTTFPEAGRKWQISTEPCAYASWSRDGREILYHGFSGQLWSVDVSTKGGDLVIGATKPLFKLGTPFAAAASFWASPDHQRFLVRNPNQQPDPFLSLVVNWPAARGVRGP